MTNYIDKPTLYNNSVIIDFLDDNALFKLKQKGRTGHDGTKNVQIIVPLKYVNNFWRTREIPLIDHVINLFLTCFPKCFIVVGTAITGTKLYVPVKTSSAQNNTELLQQSETGFKRAISWNKCQS